MTEAMIRIRNLSKRFRIGHAGRGDALDRFMDRVFGRRARRRDFWALRDVTSTVNQYENFGLIGPNGSGKSTLLKVLARVYRPTSGVVEVGGRVVPFLDLGWGLLEPEQTGFDNIFFAGILLGLSRKEIEAVFDDIVRFADLEQYLHTPLKYYSTGMQIRLSFAIALFARPEIFLVDEILAVGDFAFRRKCYEALKGLHGQEETLVFVSHDLPAMREFCDSGLLLVDGRVAKKGDIEEVIEEYMFGTWGKSPTIQAGEKFQLRSADILDVRIRDNRGRERVTYQPWEPVDLSIDFRVNSDARDLLLYVQALGEDGEIYFGTKTVVERPRTPVTGHRMRATLSIPHIPLLQGKVHFTVSAMNPSMTKLYDRREQQDSLWIVNTTPSEGKIDFHPEWR